MDKLLNALSDKTDRSAQFKTVIALNLNGKQSLFTGIAKGEITAEKIGIQGFGYDPIFKAAGLTKTFAELSLVEKSQISHRAKAMRELITFLTNK